jgi:hypothetical protein
MDTKQGHRLRVNMTTPNCRLGIAFRIPRQKLALNLLVPLGRVENVIEHEWYLDNLFPDNEGWLAIGGKGSCQRRFGVLKSDC